jgi:uncharacterized Zn finger protein
MKVFKCPKCGYIPSEKSERTCLVQCTECGTVMTEAHMLENTPPKISAGRKESPTVIFNW